MATKNMAYDHPAYLAVFSRGTGQITGSGGTSTKFSAFTSLLLKSITVSATTTATSTDAIYIVKITGTTTTTTSYGAITSGVGFVNVTPTTASNQVSCIQGDVYYVQKGTDANGTYVGTVEEVVQPLANVTV